ncbi:MAG: hypothetical protein Q9198_003849, partial [Flavoplaca austrocitrina]
APEILYKTIITKVVIISTLSGQLITSMSLLPANSTSLPNFKTMSGFNGGFGGFEGTRNDTFRDFGPTLILSVSTYLYHALLIADCTPAHGQRQCGYWACHPWSRPYSQPRTIRFFGVTLHTEWEQSSGNAWGSVAPNSHRPYGGVIPEVSFSAWGVLTPSLCSVKLPGIPFMNVPVLELTATTTVTMPGLSLRPGSLGSSIWSPQTALPQAPVRSATAAMTSSSILINSPPSLKTPSIATATGLSTASKPDELGIPIPEDHSPLEGSASQPHEDKNAEIPNSNKQPPSASVISQIHPEPSMTGTSGTAIEAGSDDQDAASGPVGSGDTSPQPNQALGHSYPSILPVVPPATTATIPASRPALAPQPVMNAGELITKDPASQSSIRSLTTTPGTPAITIDGTLVSLQLSANALVGGSSLELLTDSPKQCIVTFNGVSLSPYPGSELVICTQSLAAGAPVVTISGKAVSFAPDGTAIAVSLSTMPLVVPPAQGFITANGLSSSRGFGPNLAIDTQKLTPAVTVSRIPNTLALDRTAIVVGSSTEPLPAAPMQGIFIAGAFAFRRGSASDLVLGTQTITAGAPTVTISGTPVSLPMGGTAVVAGGSTIQLPSATAAPAVLDTNGISLTALPGSSYAVGWQTLVPGKPVGTVIGTPISLAASATAVVIGGSTFPLL